mgnify:CR=1 FL=1
MITYIKIDGFKSFHDFELEFTPFTVIAGANAAGKSNLFDALKLLSDLSDSDKIQKAFRKQRGNPSELFTQYDGSRAADTMSFAVEMLVPPEVTDIWGVTESLRYTRLRYELELHRFTNDIGMEDIEVRKESLNTIKHADDKWVRILPKGTEHHWRPKVTTGKRQVPYMSTEEVNGRQSVVIPQDGPGGKRRVYPLDHTTKTVLSSFDSVDFKHILAAREEMRCWRFLQLDPVALREPTSKLAGEDSVDAYGHNLAAALFRLKQHDKYVLKEIARKLHSFVPSFVDLDVIDDEENKQYLIVLYNKDGERFSSRILSEGTLRILTLCVLWKDPKYSGLLCFEEPENGIHPFRIGAMCRLLKGLSADFNDKSAPLRQVIVNTHSAIFVKDVAAIKEDPCVSINFAQQVSRVATIDGERRKLSVTSFVPVFYNYQMALPFTEQERKMSVQMLEDYLNTDVEAADM